MLPLSSTGNGVDMNHHMYVEGFMGKGSAMPKSKFTQKDMAGDGRDPERPREADRTTNGDAKSST